MSQSRKITILGEVLFDCFPDGKKVAGGAPFNVAWNLQAFRADPLFITAVGEDDMGIELKQKAADWGMRNHGFQTAKGTSTSVVNVELKNGNPSYEIKEDTAMDAIREPIAIDYAPDQVLYHGSLALRKDFTFNTVSNIREKWRGEVFVDINIRHPWFNADRFRPLLKGIDYLKINQSELEELSGSDFTDSISEAACAAFCRKWETGNLIITCGADGSYWYDREQLHFQPATDSIKISDTVGAGDAFASVCLKGIVEGWSRQKTLHLANAFAEKVCSLNGATTEDSDFYELNQL